MSLINDLDIFLITYNRAEKLKNTLNKIFYGSPVEEFIITVIDNDSSDETSSVVTSFSVDHNNLRYIRNIKNLGISGNIIKAMELASKKWVWFICDDDDFDWSNWGEIVQALNGDYDIVHTTYTAKFRNESYPYLLNEEAFLPTGIYRTKYIDSTTIQNAYAISYTLLPHLAIGCRVVNNRGKIFVPNKRCVLQCYDDKFNYLRCGRGGFYHRLTNYQILVGYINAYQLIEDEKLRYDCSHVLCLGQDFKHSMMWFASQNPGNDLHNIFDILLNVNEDMQKDLISVLKEKKVDVFFDLIDRLRLYCSGERDNLDHRLSEIENVSRELYGKVKCIDSKIEQFSAELNNKGFVSRIRRLFKKIM